MIKTIGLKDYSSQLQSLKWISIGLICLINTVFGNANGFSDENERLVWDSPTVILPTIFPVLQLGVDQETNLLPVTSFHQIMSSQNEFFVYYDSPLLKSKNLRCAVEIETDYSSWDSVNFTSMAVSYLSSKSGKYQIWLDSDETSIFSKTYLIDLPLASEAEFHLEVVFKTSHHHTEYHTIGFHSCYGQCYPIKTFSIHRCWNTYQSCPVLSCSTKDINNQSSCSLSSDLSFNCSTPDLCIFQDEVCDYQMNCPDGSDELNCDQTSAFMSNNTSTNELNSEISSITNLRCSFEVDYCSWKPFKLPNTSCSRGICSHDRGLIRTIAAESLLQGPTLDHTLENPNGHYLLLKSDGKRGRSTGSVVSSTPIKGNCKLVLHYYTNSPSSQILIRSSDNSSSFNPFSIIEAIDLDWEKSLFTRVEVDLDLSGEWLFLVTMIKDDKNSYLALDDIYFTKGCYPLSIPESSLSL